jgi:biotin transport system substrate-specific component
MAIASGTTLADYLVPVRSENHSRALLRDGLLVVGFSIFLALCAQVSFYLPLNPIPITLQTLAVLLTGAALGSKRGGLAMLLYLAEGAVGLPVFAGGIGGFPILFGATGGYLWSFPIAAFVVGLLCERGLDRRIITSALAMLPGTLIIYTIGVTWLGVVLHKTVLKTLPLDTLALKALSFGLVPFIPGDLLKLVIAAALLPLAWAIVKRRSI